MITREQAREAKEKAKQLIGGSVGLTMINGDYAIKINYYTDTVDTSTLPLQIDGVSIVYEVIGKVNSL